MTSHRSVSDESAAPCPYPNNISARTLWILQKMLGTFDLGVRNGEHIGPGPASNPDP